MGRKQNLLTKPHGLNPAGFDGVTSMLYHHHGLYLGKQQVSCRKKQSEGELMMDVGYEDLDLWTVL